MKDCDVIWTFVNQPHAKSSEPTIEMALVVGPDDYCHAEAHQEHKIDEAELSEEVLVSIASHFQS